MNKKELISVIVPVYKVEKYLHRCIDSILAQSFSNYEVILVDDGSPDNCPQICDNYAKQDERIKVIHKKNGGLSDARNVGIRNALGKYIAFVDSDDVLSPKYLEYLYNALTDNNCDIAICSFEKFEETVPSKNEIYDKGHIYTGVDMLWRIYSQNHVEYLESTVSWNKLYKKKLFKGICFPKGKIHEDEATTYKLFYKSKRIAVIPCKLYYYYQNNEGIMKRKFNIARLDYLEALYERYCFYKEKRLLNLADFTARLLYTYTVDYASLKENQVEDFQIFYKRLIYLYRLYRRVLLKQKLNVKEKLRILLSYIRFDFLTKHF